MPENPVISELKQQLAQAQQDNAAVGVVLAGAMLDGLQTRLLQARRGDPGAQEFVRMTRTLLQALLEEDSRIVRVQP